MTRHAASSACPNPHRVAPHARDAQTPGLEAARRQRLVANATSRHGRSPATEASRRPDRRTGEMHGPAAARRQSRRIGGTRRRHDGEQRHTCRAPRLMRRDQAAIAARPRRPAAVQMLTSAVVPRAHHRAGGARDPDRNLAEKQREQQVNPRDSRYTRHGLECASAGAAGTSGCASAPGLRRSGGRDEQPDPEPGPTGSVVASRRLKARRRWWRAPSPNRRPTRAGAAARRIVGRPAVDAICATVIGLSCHAL